MKELILHNMSIIGICLSSLAIFYFANICFSLWNNIAILGQRFDKAKLVKGILKLVMFLLGLGFLSVGLTTLPAVLTYAGISLPAETQDLISQISIAAIIMSVSVKYLIETVEKLKIIVGGKK